MSRQRKAERMCKMSARRGRAVPGASAMLFAAGLCAVVLGRPVRGGELTRAIEARRLRGGVVLLVNAGDAVYDEAAATGCVVRGLETDPDRAEVLRERFLAREVYGKVSVSAFDGETLPCIDGLVNVVLAEHARVKTDEVMRVLAPGGTALVRKGGGWESHVKPWPPEMGEWNQYLCNADNNGVAADSAGPPERLQWTGGSRYGRLKVTMPSVTSMVTAGGRIFTVEDMATTEAGGLPKRYVLLARDAFNGCELWRHPLRDWGKERCAPVKDISVQLQRRVVAVGERVYCTTGFDGPVAVFDGATGAVISTFEGTENTREFAHADGVIFGIRGEPFATRVNPARTKFADLKIGKVTLYARKAEDGNVLWRADIDGSDGYVGGTLSIRAEYLCYVTRERLHCRDSRTGKELWSRDYPYFADMPRKGVYAIRYNNSSPTIVMTDRRLFVAELDRVRAYGITDGAFLWSGATECNYTKNGDLFYARGLVWNGHLQGLDPATGEVRRKLEQKVTGPMSHDRCYRNRITHRYYINSKSGGTDLVALDGSGEFPSPWMRATCGLSITPSYGRLYSSPYVCACEIGAMLLGFNCTYTASRDRGEVLAIRPEPRLVRGKAHGAAAGGPAATGADWPTYRHDNARSGATASAIPERLDVVWKASLPGSPTAPVVAGGLLFVAVRDMHTLFALECRTGRRRWRFTADGRIDSPPTYHDGLVLFGSRDGWVYCLEARSGELVWRFSDKPRVRLLCDSEQLESAWPVNGSVMVRDNLAYFAAGRSSFLDGGITVYALDPETGEVKHRRTMAGPYDGNKFPRVQRGSTFRSEGFRSGIFSSDGGNLYIRHQGFRPDLTPISPYDVKRPHLIASTGFLCDSPQHRTYWTIDTDLSYGPAKGFDADGPQGDVTAVDGDTFYEVRGYFVGRHPQPGADPLKMYKVVSGTRRKGPLKENLPREQKHRPPVPRRGRWRRRWSTHVPIAGHAILAAGGTVVVAGVPMRAGFTTKDIEGSYGGGRGGLLWTLSAVDGGKTGELVLPAPPVWDGLAVAHGRCYLPLRDGTVLCLGNGTGRGRVASQPGGLRPGRAPHAILEKATAH